MVAREAHCGHHLSYLRWWWSQHLTLVEVSLNADVKTLGRTKCWAIFSLAEELVSSLPEDTTPDTSSFQRRDGKEESKNRKLPNEMHSFTRQNEGITLPPRDQSAAGWM